MNEPRNDDQLTTGEGHLIALLRQGPQSPQRLAEGLGLTLEQTLHLIQHLDRFRQISHHLGFQCWGV